MNESLNNLATIRQYLLGKISDETMLEGIEELLFSDDEFCNKTEIVEDELINDYVFGKLNSDDNLSFEKTLENNSNRRAKVKVTQLLKEKVVTVEVEEKVSFLESIKAFFRQPIYAGGFALLLIAILIGAILLSRSPNNPELAELKNIYKDNRPIESRISEFDYAPYEVTRGEDKLTDAEKRKLKIIENDLLKKVDGNPTANNHNTLGVFYLSQRKYSEAIKSLEESVKLEPNNAQFQNDLGSALFEFGKNGDKNKRFITLSKANESFSKALEISPNLIEALFNKSLYLQENKLYFEAKKSWENYLQKDSNSKWADEARKNLEKISQIQSSLTKMKDDILNEFLTAYRNNDEKMVWKIHNSTKGVLSGIALADQLSRRFLEARKNKDDTIAKESIEALTYIGKLEKEQHADFFFADLVDYYANISDAKIDKLLQAKGLLEEGVKLFPKQKYKEAIEKFESSKIIFEQNGNEIEANIANLLIGEAMPDAGMLNEGLIKLDTFIKKVEENNFKIFLPPAHYWMAVSYYRKNELSKANKSLQTAITIAEVNNNFVEIEHAAENLALNYSDIGDIEKSLNYLGKTIETKNIFYQNPYQSWRNLTSITDATNKLGFCFSSIEFAEESVRLSKEVLGDSEAVNLSLNLLAKTFVQSNRFAEALRIANESKELALSKGVSNQTINNIADTFLWSGDIKREVGKYEEAIDDYEKSTEFFSQIPDVTYNLYEIHKGKLLCLRELKRQTEFESELATVLKLSENYRQQIKEDASRQSFFANEQDVFDVAISHTLQQQNNQEAFEYIETSRSRSLLEFVKSKKSIIEIEQDFNNISKPLNLKEIQAQMPENVQIVEYSVLPDKIAIWLITKSRFELFEKPFESEKLAEQINEYQNLIKRKGEVESIKTIAKKFYELLIPTDLEPDKIVCLIPDKSLHRIPFASLISPNDKYLIEEFALLNSPSSSVFVTLTEKAKNITNNEQLLTIGNPKFDREINQNLADLPDAEIEAKEIAKNYQNSRKFIAEEATKQNFLDNFVNAEIIHFAGHFVVNEQSIDNSRMLFADSDLFAFELSDKKLSKSKLVVLSACETGLEKINNSEGAVGIYRTFLALGTPLVVASNWKVESVATKDLMISFHKKRTGGKLSSIEALRQAQLEMLKTNELSHPYYWSAFSINGGLANY